VRVLCKELKSSLSGSSQERFRVYCKTLNRKGKKTSRELAYPSHNFFFFPREREKNRRESKSERERPSPVLICSFSKLKPDADLLSRASSRLTSSLFERALVVLRREREREKREFFCPPPPPF